MRAKIASGWLLAFLILGGCAGISAPEGLSGIAASRVVIFEGLPHQMMEQSAFDAEKRGPKPIIELRGYSFYREPLTIKPDDQARLIQTLSDPATYEAFGGEKKCGGFHPDYAVEWVSKDVTRIILLCFGCGEAKLVGPEGDVRYDLGKSAQGLLQALLEAHRKNRPEPGHH